MTTFSANHKPLPEYDVDPARIPELVDAARQLPGVSTTVARNFGGWLLLVHAGDPEGGSSAGTRVRFRKILRQLVEAKAPTPTPRRPRYQTPVSEEDHPQRIAA